MSLGIDATATSASTARTCADPVSGAFYSPMEGDLRKRLSADPDCQESGFREKECPDDGFSGHVKQPDCSSQQHVARSQQIQDGPRPENVVLQKSNDPGHASNNHQTNNGPQSVLSQIRNWVLNTHKKYARYMNSRARPGDAYVPTVEEHIANMCTHGVLVLPSIVAIFWMVHLASDNLQHFIAIIYGIALVVLFGVSTIFHVLSYCGQSTSLRNLFHIGDRAVIYIFIAASYTPWLTLKEYDGWGSTMLWIVWIAAMLGIFYQYTFHEKYKWLETLFYLAIGVCPSVVCLAMKEKSGIFELAFGGMLYISGVVFFKCDGLIPFAHAIWHCFVTTGAVCHYQAVCTYLLGPHNQITRELTS